MLSSLLTSIIAGSAYAIYNGLEKYILQILGIKLNTYFLCRYIAILLIIFTIYIIFERHDDAILNLSHPKINTNILVLLIFITAFMVIFSDYITSYGLRIYSISEFSFMVILVIMIVNLIIGVIVFKEVLDKKQIFGIVLAIISILLINKKDTPRNRHYYF